MGPGGLLRREHMTVSRGERVPRIPSPSNSCSGRFGYQTVYRKSFSVQSSADLGIAGEGLWVLPNAAVAATKLGICPCNPIQFSQLYEQDADISASQDPRAGAAASDFLSLAVACKLKSKHLLYLGEERELDMCIVWVCACARMCVFQNEPDSINKYLFFFLSFKQTS